MNEYALEQFILKARKNTYASATMKSAKPLIKDTVQYEYAGNNYFYRDIYCIGNGIFSGLEVIYHKNELVWSMSYFGDFSGMTEVQADTLLRRAILDLWESTRMYEYIEKNYDDFLYTCKGSGTIKKMKGIEEIHVAHKKVYTFSYNGGCMGKS